MRLCIIWILLMISIKTFVPERKILKFWTLLRFNRNFQLLTDVNFCSRISDFRYILAYVTYMHLLILFSVIAHLYRCKKNFQCNINNLYRFRIRIWLLKNSENSIILIHNPSIWNCELCFGFHFLGTDCFSSLLFYRISFCVSWFIKLIAID